MTLLDRLNRFPPCLCRLLARKSHGLVGLSHDEIAERAGLPRSTVVRLSLLTTWSGITLDVANKFLQGCGVDPFKSEYQVDFLKRRGLAYVDRAPHPQRMMYYRILKRLNEVTPRSASPAG